jgi:phosphoribosylamine--glycine ligase
MKVLVVGSGGREHALAWKLQKSKKVEKVFCAPGNAGIAQIAKCVNINPGDSKAVLDFAKRNKIGLTVIGPEDPLANGLADDFKKRRLKVFGPEKKAAQIEASKVFAKEFMREYHIPTAPFKVFSEAAEAISFSKTLQFPAVIKADGLAAGKGVIVVRSRKQAEKVIGEIMVDKRFGAAGKRIIIESFLKGQELSIMAITDGRHIVPLLPSQDHKQLKDGDRGPNTGGMGAYCPVDFVTPEIQEQIQEHILTRTIAGFKNEKIRYRGVLYAGLMLTEQGPKVLEFNCRFGDPETQAILPLLKTDLAELLMSAATGKLGSFAKLSWHRGAAACVVMASRGYPGNYRKGIPIKGLDAKTDQSTNIFHAGTAQKNGKWVTAGGRVLSVVGRDRDLKQALSRAYRTVNKIRFDGAHFRKDIGHRAGEPAPGE